MRFQGVRVPICLGILIAQRQDSNVGLKAYLLGSRQHIHRFQRWYTDLLVGEIGQALAKLSVKDIAEYELRRHNYERGS